MSSVTIDVPAGFSWVAASLFSIVPVLSYQAAVVGMARKKASVRYPQLYAEKVEQETNKDAMIFNCAQRAHQNTLENVPTIILTTVLSAIHYPIYAAVGCGIWSFARVLYTRGYSTGDPSRRRFGSNVSLSVQSLLILLSGKVVFDLVKAAPDEDKGDL